jgi:hypothetical protein
VYFVYLPLLAAALRVVCALDHLHYAEHLVLVAYTVCLLIALLASDAHASPRGAI